jgi:potassium efflux system protein
MRTRLCHLKAPIWLLLSALLLSPLQASAQAPAQASVQEQAITAGVSRQVIETRIEEAQAATDLDESSRAELIKYYRQALGFMEAQLSNTTSADAYAQSGDSVPQKTRQIREKLEQAQANPVEVTLDVAEDASAQQIEQRLQRERANQAAVAAQLGSLEQQLAAQVNRPDIVRQRLVEASHLTDNLASDLSLLPPPGESTLVAEARRWVLSTQAAAVNAEIRMLDQELLSQPIRIELWRAQRDSETRTLNRINKRLAMLEELLSSQRRSEAAQIIADLDLSAFGDAANHPLVLEQAEKNRQFGTQLQILTASVEQAETDGTAAAKSLREIQKSFQTAKSRLEIAGLSQALGQVLHEQRRDLPNISLYQRRTRQRAELIAEAGLQDIRLEAERRATQDVAGYINSLLTELSPAKPDELAEPLKVIITSRRALLRNMISTNTQYMRALGELEFQESRVQMVVAEFDAYLAKRLLWVRSKGAIGIESLVALPAEIIRFFAPAPWLTALSVLLKRATESPWLFLTLLTSGVLLARTTALRNALRNSAAQVGNTAQDSIRSTLRAAGISLLLTLPWPLLSFVTGLELIQAADASDDVKAIGMGILQITRALFFLRAFRILCIAGGLADAHFNWPDSVTTALRRQLNQLLLTFLLPGFVMLTCFARYPAEFGGELSRVTFVLATIGVMVFLFRLLQPNGDIAKGIRRAQGHESEISWLWALLGASAPFVLAVAALDGYMYSALTLMTRLTMTLWLLFGLIFAHELAVRWVLIAHRRIQLNIALERREAERVKREKAADQNAGGEDYIENIAEPDVDIASIDADTKKLLNLALVILGFILLSGIWSSVLPALGILSDITLWEYLGSVAGEQQLIPLTLADLALTAVYGFSAFVLVRTVPSLLDLILRQRSSVTSGSRLAFATLARYVIVLVGLSLVAGSVGFNWGQIQWLVAALGVGIGFGLQEIVANFISGLIILVERPIRVGDIVTVGDISGTVSRLQIRATTVTTFDRQELLVPNKEFIAGRVLNWSLSDEILRLVLKVGIAYGSDVPKALALVREAVNEHKLVLDEPPPLITFDEFGDNSLNITARCFIGALNKRRETVSDLNLAINQKLNKAGIVIAFPQRDVHLDMATPLDIRIHGEPPVSK